MLFLRLLLFLVLITLIPLAAPAWAATDSWWHFIKMANSHMEVNRFKEALPFCQNALKEAKQFKKNDPRYSETLRLTANTYLHLGKYREAEPLLNEELGILSQFGENFPDLDFDYFWLGVLKEQNCDVKQAEELYRKAYRILRDSVKERGLDPNLETVCSHLAAVLYAQGKDAEAKQFLEIAARYMVRFNYRVVKSVDQVRAVRYDIGDRHVALSERCPTLAQSYLKVAVTLTECVVAASKTSDADKSQRYHALLHELADVYICSGFSDKAEKVALEGLKLMQQSFPDDLLSIGYFQLQLGQAARSPGKYDQAESWFSKAYDTIKKAQMDPAFVNQMDRVIEDRAWNYKYQGKIAKAIGFLESNLDVVTDTQRKNLELVLADFSEEQATQLQGAGDSKGAQAALQKCYEIRSRSIIKSKRNERYYSVAQSLAHYYVMAKNYAGAQPMLEDVVGHLGASESLLQRDIARRAALDLAIIYKATGKSSEVAKLNSVLSDDFYNQNKKRYQEKIAAAKIGSPSRRRLIGELAAIELHQAGLYASENRIAQAIAEYKAGLSEIELSQGHPLEYLRSAIALASLLFQTKQYDVAEQLLQDVIDTTRTNPTGEYLQLLKTAVKDLKKLYEATGRRAERAGLDESRFIEEAKVYSAYTEFNQRRCYKKQAAVLEKILKSDTESSGTNIVGVIRNYERLIPVSWWLEDWSAVKRFGEVYVKLRPTFPGLPPNRFATNNCIASAYLHTGNPVEAEKLLRKSIANPLFKECQGEIQIVSYYQLAVAMLMSKKDRKDAWEYIKRARDLAAHGSPLYMIDLWLSACIHPLQKNNDDDLQTIIDDELRLYQNAGGLATPGKVTLLRELAQVTATKGNKDKALQTYQRALETARELKVTEPWYFELKVLRPYEHLLRGMNRTKEAEKLATNIKALEKKCE